MKSDNKFMQASAQVSYFYFLLPFFVPDHSTCILFWIPKRQAISTDTSFEIKMMLNVIKKSWTDSNANALWYDNTDKHNVWVTIKPCH